MIHKFTLKALLLFLFITGYFNKALAQDEYFITKKNDTVKCSSLRETQITGSKLRYTTANSPKFLTVNKDTIYEYLLNYATYTGSYYTGSYYTGLNYTGLSKVIFTRRLLPGDTALSFVRWIHRGKVNLYELSIGGGQTYFRGYYAAKGANSLAEIKTNQLFASRKDKMAWFYKLIEDYPELLNKFKAANDYDFDAINAAIKEYNCFNDDAAKTYFVTLKGDTVKCKIVEKIAAAISKDGLAYKTPTATHFKSLDLDSVKEYTFNDLLITRCALPGEADPKLVSWIERGKLNYYQYTSPNNAKSWYLAKSDGPLVLVNGKGSVKEQKKAFVELIADFPELLEQFKGNIYNERVIKLTIATYNKMKKN